MPKIISTPTQKENTTGSNKEHQFGYFETINSRYRDFQEDALTWQTLDPKDLTAAGDTDQLSAKKLVIVYGRPIAYLIKTLVLQVPLHQQPFMMVKEI